MLVKQLSTLVFALGLGAAPIARAADNPEAFSQRVQALVDSQAKDTHALRSEIAGAFLRGMSPVSKQGLVRHKESLAEIADSAKMLLASDDPADVLLGLRMLECIDYMVLVEISRQYASEREEALAVAFVEQSVDAELVDFLAQRRAVDPAVLLRHVLGMQGLLQKELLARGLNEEALVEGVRLRHLSDSAREQYDAVKQDLRYLDALPDKQVGDYLLLESLYLCDLQSDVALMYKAYAQQADALGDMKSFGVWAKEEIVRHPSKRLLQGKANHYVLLNGPARKLFFQKESRKVKFWFLGERMWPFISGLDEGHGLTVDEKATIQQLAPGHRPRKKETPRAQR